MDLHSGLRPKPSLTDKEVARGLKMMTWEGITSIALNSVTTSGFLAAFALALGANSFQIGILAAIPFIMQTVQLPTILLVERLRMRKAIAVLSWYPAQAIWILVALIPFMVDVPSPAAVSILLGLFALRGALTAICNCAWFGWVRDLVPQQVLGRFHSRRLSLATAAAIGFGLAGAFFVDYWEVQAAPGSEIWGYTIVLLTGALLLGLSDPTFMAFMPEPQMAAPGPRISIRRLLATPFRDRNFRQLMNFLFFWGFAANIAVPFFAVYMLSVLNFSVLAVMALSVLSQVFNVLFFRVWGPFADRFGSKVVLSLSTSLYLLVIGAWVFAAMPDRYFLTVPLVTLLHVFAGIASAGVTLTVNTLGYKLAPQDQATPYLVGASLASSIGAGIGPLLGGFLAHFFSARELTFTIGWNSPSGVTQLPTVLLSGFDFLFVLAFVMGLIIMNTLTTIREEGEADRQAVLDELMMQTRQLIRGVNSVPALRFVAAFPYAYLQRVPGMDVALGVTAYQVATGTRVAVAAAHRGGQAVEEVARRVSHALSEAIEHADDVTGHGAALVAQATKGALHAVNELGLEMGHLARGALLGAIESLGRTQTDPLDVFWGLGYGIIQGAEESGRDLRQAASQLVQTAQGAARELGVPQEAATASIVQGALEAVKGIGPDAAAQVREVLREQPSEKS